MAVTRRVRELNAALEVALELGVEVRVGLTTPGVNLVPPYTLTVGQALTCEARLVLTDTEGTDDAADGV